MSRKHVLYFVPADLSRNMPRFPRGVAPRHMDLFFDGCMWWARRWRVVDIGRYFSVRYGGVKWTAEKWTPALYWGDGPPKGFKVDHARKAQGPLLRSPEIPQ